MRYGLLAALLLCRLGQAQEERPAPARVTIVPIVGPLDASHVALVARASRLIRQEKPDLVLFEIDTPGGRIDHMLRIGEDIMGLAPIPTAAYVRPAAKEGITGGAWSAGAYVAMSCRRLYMHPGTVIGAAAPVTEGENGPQPVDEKYVSAFREKFRARAEQNGYPANLAVAMVDKDLEVFQVTVDGRQQYLTAGEIETLRREGKEVDKPEVPFVAKDKLLTLTDRQVVETGMGRAAASRQEIFSDLGLTNPQERAITPTWSESLVGFLTSPVVAFLLLVIGMLGIWIELKTPGFGAPGILGIAAIALLLFGHHLAGLAEATEIILIVAGLALIAVEIFVLPGTFIAGIGGVLLVFAGLILSLQDFTVPDIKGAPWQLDILLASLGRVILAFVGAAIGFISVLRFLPNVPVMRKLVLQAELAEGAPATAGTSELQGRMGHAATPLRPGGKIEIDGQEYDVVADGEFVAPGETVEVLRVEGMRIVVGKVKR
ncbi:MAG: nodulation protein NfeD [Planctomycetes bacterium]|nr:nodulation protein NfeD [Planctomycetota bacterium]